MRNNQTVTNNELKAPKDQTLISVTDLKGRIVYCDQNFVSISGFSTDDLMGQLHSMIRHPDMPTESFRDMWATIRVGPPWTALPKNRRKYGDFYWVRANSTLIRGGDQILGFLSVRAATD